jgi:sortase A
MKKISSLLILIGVLLFLIPIIGQGMSYLIENKLVSDWKSGQTSANSGAYSELYKAYNKLADIFDMEDSPDKTAQTKAPSGSSKTGPSDVKKADSQRILGLIKIEKIKVYLPIVEGIKKENLRVGIGHIPGTAALGSPGNSCLAGHRSYTLGRFFNSLDKLIVGDNVTIITKKTNYIYKVYEKLVVTPDTLSILDSNNKENIITLITCTPIYKATHRLVIHARLENKL